VSVGAFFFCCFYVLGVWGAYTLILIKEVYQTKAMVNMIPFENIIHDDARFKMVQKF